MGTDFDDFVDLLYNDCCRVCEESCVCSYEDVSVHICCDIFEYQQMQVVEDSIASAEVNADMEVATAAQW